MSAPHTVEDSYTRALECLEQGQVPACIPVRYNGVDGVWTTAGVVDPSYQIESDLDILAVAIISIKRAYKEALKAGAHPVN